jgi:polysaccharide biosynthesis/export protein
MKSRPDYPFIIGFLLVVICSSLLGQSPAPQTDPSPSAPVASDAGATPTAAKPHDNSFVIGSDDRLSINVWKETDLTETVPVRSDGKISMPLIGELQAAGKTPLQLEQDIAGKLKTYITDPEVTVMVTQINSEKFNILGRVIKPGSYSLTTPLTILDAIALAGGFQDFAKKSNVYVLRQTPGGGDTRIPFNYKEVIRGKHPEQNIRLLPHDTIVVP